MIINTTQRQSSISILGITQLISIFSMMSIVTNLIQIQLIILSYLSIITINSNSNFIIIITIINLFNYNILYQNISIIFIYFTIIIIAGPINSPLPPS